MIKKIAALSVVILFGLSIFSMVFQAATASSGTDNSRCIIINANNPDLPTCINTGVKPLAMSSHRAVYIPYLIESNISNNHTGINDDLLLYNSIRWCANTTGNITVGVLRSWASYNKNASVLPYLSTKHPAVKIAYIAGTNITYTDIQNTSATVLFISNASAKVWEFNDYEIAAITQYVNEGHGIIATYGTLVSPDSVNNGKLSPLFDIIAAQRPVWSTPFYRISIINKYNPVCAGLPSEYLTNSYILGSALGINSLGNSSVPIITEGPIANAPIIVYDSFKATHDIAISQLQIPDWSKPNQKITIKSVLKNYGLMDESNIVVNLTVNGTNGGTILVVSLPSGTVHPISFDYTPKGVGIYSIEIKCEPVAGELANYTWNNKLDQDLPVMFFYQNIKAVVLRSPGLVSNYSYMSYWNDLSAHWYNYVNLSKAYSIVIDTTTFVTGAITENKLNSTKADVVIVPSCNKNYDGNPIFNYSDSEINAIWNYVKTGKGIIGTFSTAADHVNNNIKLIPLFGLNESVPGNMPTTDNFNGIYDFTPYKSQALFNHIVLPYTSGFKRTVTGLASNTTHVPIMSLASTDGKGLISAYKDLTDTYSGVYISHPIDMLSYRNALVKPQDRQLLFNSIVWTRLNSKDNVPPVVTVLQPNGGETLHGGLKYTVKWSAYDMFPADNSINISYSLNSSSPPWVRIGTNLPNTGSYLWDVPQDNSQTVRLMITAYDNSSNVGTGISAFDFEIDSKAPVAKIFSPTTGDILGPGMHEISWNATDNFGLAKDPIDLSYSEDNGVTWTAIKQSYPNSPPFPWNISQSVQSSTQCRMNLTVADASGLLTTDYSGQFVIDTEKPVPVIKFLPGSIVAPKSTVTFDASGSTDNTGILNYTWNYMVGSTPVVIQGMKVNVSIPTLGKYTITLTVYDKAGNYNSTSSVLTVGDVNPPVANAGVDATIDMGTVYHFDGSGTTDDFPSSLNFTWKFVDGTLKTLYGMFPTYRFDSSGIFIVTLSARNIANLTGTDSMTVTVQDTKAPTVVSVTPKNCTTKVQLNTTIIIDFSKSMDPKSTQNSLTGLPKGTFVWSNNNQRLSILMQDPQNASMKIPLDEYSNYTVKISSNALDSHGNRLRPITWWFYTAEVTLPEIVTNPVTSANEGDNVQITAQISAKSGVALATLYYQNGGSAWSSIQMIPNQPTLYEAAIPSVKAGTLNYYIEAQSNYGNSALYPTNGTYTITVTPNTPILVYAISAMVLAVAIILLFLVMNRRKTEDKKPKKTVIDRDKIYPSYVSSERKRSMTAVDNREEKEEQREKAKPKRKEEKKEEPKLHRPVSTTILEPELEETIKRWARKKQSVFKEDEEEEKDKKE